MEAPDRTKLNEMIQSWNQILDNIRLNQENIRIRDVRMNEHMISALKVKIDRIFDELIIQQELELNAIKAGE